MCLLVEEMQVKHLSCRPGKQSLQERVIIRDRMHFNPTILSLKKQNKRLGKFTHFDSLHSNFRVLGHVHLFKVHCSFSLVLFGGHWVLFTNRFIMLSSPVLFAVFCTCSRSRRPRSCGNCGVCVRASCAVFQGPAEMISAPSQTN